MDKRMIFEIHRLSNEGNSGRKIARTLDLNRKTVAKYLKNPGFTLAKSKRTIVSCKLDPFKEDIDRILEKAPSVSSAVIFNRIKADGYKGGKTILKDYLKTIRKKTQKRTYIRFESKPGEQCQIDWGHFGTISYGNTSRKLYALAVVESHSRLLFVEFTHSQRQEAVHRCLIHAFHFFGGTPKEVVVDNMLTAVLERDGPFKRYNEAFLEFLQPFKIVPRACNVRAPYEKGKIEKGGIHYLRYNFMPLRKFSDLEDVRSQVLKWLDEIANPRIHGTTGERPCKRFQKESMRPLPEFLPDVRDIAQAKVHSDFAIRFETNAYTVPPWFVGKAVTVKACHKNLSIYYQEKIIAGHPRCWDRKIRVENPEHVEEAKKRGHHRPCSEEMKFLMGLGETMRRYLESIESNRLPLKKNINKLFFLCKEYDEASVLEAIKRAVEYNAFGADYIENILYQEMTPEKSCKAILLKNKEYNKIRIKRPSLKEYDALAVIKRRKNGSTR